MKSVHALSGSVLPGLLASSVLVLSLLPPAALRAEEELELDPILVTDGLTPVEARSSGRTYTIIDREKIEQGGVRPVSELLRMVPGVSVSQTGSFGGLTQIRMRGAEANHTLVLIDGVEVGDTSTGEYDLGGLLTEDIERIEVLRGPQSTFYGSNALAGVINIITRRGDRGGWTRTLGAELGTDGTTLGRASLSGGGQGYDLNLAGVWDRTDGFDISGMGGEKDGGRNLTLNGRFAADLSETIGFDATLRYSKRTYNGDPQDFAWGSPTYGQVIDGSDDGKVEEGSGALGLTHSALGGAFEQSLRASGSFTNRDYFQNGARTSWNDGDRVKLAYQAGYGFGTSALVEAEHRITGGVDWKRETFSPSHIPDDFARETTSLMAEYRGTFAEQWHLTLGARQDFNDAFDDATTWTAALGWTPTDTTRVHASAGRGVTDPSFYEQYGYDPGTFIGNPGLTPEKSFGWDIGIEQGFLDQRLIVDLTYFQQNLTDEISTVYNPDFSSTPVNLDGTSRRKGVELSLTAEPLDGLTVTGTYTWILATEPSATGRVRELRRPKNAASLDIRQAFWDGRANVFAELVYNGVMYDSDFSTGSAQRVALDDYTVVTIGGQVGLTDTLTLTGRVENLFDTDYEEVNGYGTAGIAGYIGLTARF